jgi:hypothetical protein
LEDYFSFKATKALLWGYKKPMLFVTIFADEADARNQRRY